MDVMGRPMNEDLQYLVLLKDGTYVRKMKWDRLWHHVLANPAIGFWKARYNRISVQKAWAWIRHRAAI